MLVSHEREKMINAIIYFANHTRHLGKIKLFKLLYLLDFEHFRLTGRSVTGLDYRAWKFGPVPVALEQEWEDPEPDMVAAIRIEPEKVIDYVRETVAAQAEFDDSHFTRRELRIMGTLAEQYRDELSHRMIDVTHAENGAWARIWNDGRGFDQPIDYALSLAENDPNRAAILQFAHEHQALIQTQRN
ncbi:Panacea domain-containing protein [Propionivibrio sp.]|uniref:Panacea domain-containing protein n=1 Tax=Propionivibrio sp. TaxID=2212460 RepID=UPI003BF3F7CC